MYKPFAGLLVAVLALTGCKTKSQEGGGAGNDTFKIVVPTMATDVRQGELQTVRVAVERGDGFKQQVKLELKAPADIQVEPAQGVHGGCPAAVRASDVGQLQQRHDSAAPVAADSDSAWLLLAGAVALAGGACLAILASQ